MVRELTSICNRTSKDVFSGHLARFNLIFLVLFIGQMLWSSSVYAHGQDAVRIAITPCTDIIKTFKVFQPLALYLEGKLGRPVELVIPQDFYAFESVIKKNKVDFAYQAPHTYVRLVSYYNPDSLLKALTPEGEETHRGLIITRKDSSIRSLEDLKGKMFIFGSELSTAKSVAVKDLLKKNEIDVDTDLQRHIHDGSCESIALNVYLKAVDAGAVCDYSFEDINTPEDVKNADIPPNQLRILAETEAVPTWVFSALKQTEAELVAQVHQALRELDLENEGARRILEMVEVGGFVPAQDRDYEQIRAMKKGLQN